MKIGENIAKVIDRRIDEAYRTERDACSAACNKLRRDMDAKIEKIKSRPLTKAQMAKVEALLANNDIVDRHSLMTKAQKEQVLALRKKRDGRETTEWRRRDKILRQLTKLKEAIGADLELCNNEDEQRAVLARFKTHPLDKSWIIPKKPHTNDVEYT